MQAARFKQWLASLVLLNRRQREQLLALLRPAVGLDQVCATIEDARSVTCCPGCGGRRIHRHGHDRGVQRYRCCACGKTYKAFARAATIWHEAVNLRAGERVRGAVHVQNVNA